MFSEKEQQMFTALGLEKFINCMLPSNLYRLAVDTVFLENKTGEATESLRRTYEAYKNLSPYRKTKEFDDLISL